MQKVGQELTFPEASYAGMRTEILERPSVPGILYAKAKIKTERQKIF